MHFDVINKISNNPCLQNNNLLMKFNWLTFIFIDRNDELKV